MDTDLLAAFARRNVELAFHNDNFRPYETVMAVGYVAYASSGWVALSAKPFSSTLEIENPGRVDTETMRLINLASVTRITKFDG